VSKVTSVQNTVRGPQRQSFCDPFIARP